jgi:predicted ABC-type ATPase
MDKQNTFSAGNFFKSNPDKVLGEAYEASGRFGKVTKYKGEIDVLDKIDVKLDFLPKDTLYNPTASTTEISVDKTPTDIKRRNNIESASVKSKDDVIKILKEKPLKKRKSIYIEPTEAQLLSFEEIFERYRWSYDKKGNKVAENITYDELNAFAYWKNHYSDDPLRGQWITSGLVKEPTEDHVINWVKNQVLCYLKGDIVPQFLYLSENIYEKKTALQEDKGNIVSIYGQETFDKQEKLLLDAFQKQYNDRLRIDHVEADKRLTILPTSMFAREFMIKSLMDEIPFKVAVIKREKGRGNVDFEVEAQGSSGRVRGRDKQLVQEMSLVNAFLLWLVREKDSIKFTKMSNYQEVLDYMRGAPRPHAMEKEEWARIKSRAKDNSERLFMEFLANNLLTDDKDSLELEWNQKFNSYVRPDYDKVPVAFRVGAEFRNEPFDLRWEKREAVAFMTVENSGCLAFDVGFGKAEFIENQIFTPTGTKRMGDIQIGDLVMGSNGKPTKVLGVYPQGKKEMFRVNFSDKSSVVVCGEHLWQVQSFNQRFNTAKTTESKRHDKKEYEDKDDRHYIFTTKEILEKGIHNYRGDAKWMIPMAKPVEFKDQNVWIDPYLMGTLLGDDGMSTNGSVSLSSADEEIVQSVREVIPHGTKITKKQGGKYDYYISRQSGLNDGKYNEGNPLVIYLRNYGLMGKKAHDKFIPEEYKFNSVEKRMAIFQGLMDTDGYMVYGRKRGQTCSVQFTTTSKQLSDDMIFLAQSFGGTASIYEKHPTYTYKGEKKNGRLAYVMTFRLPPHIEPFRLKRKAKLHVPKTKYQPVRFITNIEPAGNLEAQCIRVEAQDHLYLTENFIVTHNTLSCIFSILQFMDAGLCKRPIIVVPNQTYKQWISEIRQSAPHIKINDLYNLREQYRDELLGKGGKIMKVDEYSITMLTYEGFEMLSFNSQTESTIKGRLYEILSQGGEEFTSGKKGDRKKAMLMEKIETLMGKGMKGGMVSIEDLGIDFFAMDEAHNGKKIFTRVQGKPAEQEGGRSRQEYKISSGQPSDRGLKAFLVAHYVMHNNSQRNVMLLTATPFTNSPLEVFSMLAIVAWKKLEEMGIANLNNFFDTYIDVEEDLVINAQLKPVRKQVVKGFNNLKALQQLIYRFINYKNADLEDAKGRTVQIIRPKKIVLPYEKIVVNGQTITLEPENKVSSILPLTPLQSTLMKDIISYAEGGISLSDVCEGTDEADTEGDKAPDDKDQTEQEALHEGNLDKDEKAGVRTLRAVNFARNLALSPYLYKCSGLTSKPTYKEYIETSNKLKYVMDCIKSVKKYHEGKGEPVSGQIIYMDRGVDYFPLIKDYLVNVVGYKEHEVGIIKSTMTEVDLKGIDKSRLPKYTGGEKNVVLKSYIQNLFLGRYFDETIKDFRPIDHADRIKVIIGSSTIREGLNLQTHSTVLYDCFLDWNPTDFAQLVGRLWRQGNEYKNVRIVVPLMENSMDVFIFQKLYEKTERINALWNLNGKTNVLNLQEFDPKELKYSLIRDPRIMAQIDAEDEKMKLADEKAELDAEIKTLKNAKEMHDYIEANKEDLLKEAQSVRPSKAKPSSSIDSLIALIMEALKSQKDEKGKKFNEGHQYGGEYKADNVMRMDWYSGINEFDQFRGNYRKLKAITEKILKPRKLTVNDIEKVVTKLEKDLVKLDKAMEEVMSERSIGIMAEEHAREQERKQIVTRPIDARVKEFGTMNYLLSIKRKPEDEKEKEFYPLYEADGKTPRTDDEAIGLLEENLPKLPQTKDLYSDWTEMTFDEVQDRKEFIIKGEEFLKEYPLKYQNKDGEMIKMDGSEKVLAKAYTPERKKLHREIIAKFITETNCISEGQPIAIMTGGVPASGKSRYLKRSNISWINSSNVFQIDSDAVKAMIPEYKGWNAHLTHAESQDIVREMIDTVGKPCKYDLVLDGTMNKARNYIPLIERVKKMGFKVFMIYMKLPALEIALKRSLNRYTNPESGYRYVPKGVIQDAWENSEKTFQSIRELADGWVLVDGVTSEVIEKGGEEIPKTRDYDKLSKTEVIATEDKFEVKAISKAEQDQIEADGIKAKKLKLAQAKAKAQKQKIEIMKLKMGLPSKMDGGQMEAGGDLFNDKDITDYSMSGSGDTLVIDFRDRAGVHKKFPLSRENYHKIHDGVPSPDDRFEIAKGLFFPAEMGMGGGLSRSPYDREKERLNREYFVHETLSKDEYQKAMIDLNKTHGRSMEEGGEVK